MCVWKCALGAKCQTGQQLSSAVGTSAVDQLFCHKQTLLGLEGLLGAKGFGFDSKVKEVCRNAPALGFESVPERLKFSQPEQVL